MKRFILYTIVLMVVATITVAVVSCKKENRDTLVNNNAQPVKTFTPPQVDDMNAYLKEFKQKMQTATRGDNETLDLEEAAWYLSSVANYDFANVNVEFTDLRYDTLYYQVNVTNGQVLLTNLNTLYTSVANDIDAFYQNLNLENKHFRFIGASISNNGEVEVSLITSFRSLDHTWYFTDWFEAGVMCDSLFSEDSIYVWNGLGLTTLEQSINLLEGHFFILPDELPLTRSYYVYTRDLQFDYDNYSDPQGSPFIGNSRIFAVEADTYAVPILNTDMMCYCLDSYTALPFENISFDPHSYIVDQERPVHWIITPRKFHIQGHKWHTFCHRLTVILGRRVDIENQIEY